MMSEFKFKGKTVMIISPQGWNHISISKHHYALALSEHGCNVFFLEGPSAGNNKTEIFRVSERLKVIKPGIPKYYWLRFHSFRLFDFFFRKRIKSILNKIGVKIDVVWSFEPNVFRDLDDFGADLKIFHPVDPIEKTRALQIAETADILFSVSTKILNFFDNIEIPKYFINHALSPVFISESTSLEYNKEGAVKFGYVGNLIRAGVDRDIFLKIVTNHREITFVIWGPYEDESGILDVETRNFVNSLISLSNVQLMGKIGHEELPRAMKNVDGFFIFYEYIEGVSDCSNSHKILEYLSTGKVVVSSHIETYKEQKNLVVMPDTLDNDQILEVFNEVVNNLGYYNTRELQNERIEFSRSNSVLNQIARIETYINNHQLG